MLIILPPPATLRPLVERYAGRTQAPVEYRVSTWRQALEPWPAVARVLTDDRWSTATDGDRRSVTREHLDLLLRATDLTDPLATRQAFLQVMVWGSGVRSRSYRYVPMALQTADCADRLAAAARTCRDGDLAGAYATFRLPGVGRSFFTKWFAFAGRVPGRAWQPLILDDRVLATLNRTLRHSTVRLSGGSRSWPVRYEAYVHHLHQWSRILTDQGLPCTADRLEWILFRHDGDA